MSRRRPPWSALGIDPTGDERVIKRQDHRVIIHDVKRVPEFS